MVPILSLVLLISVSLLVQSAPQLAGRSAPRHAKEEAAWAIEVLTFSPSERKFVWAGLINKSDEPLLVCILDKGVSLSDKDGTLMVSQVEDRPMRALKMSSSIYCESGRRRSRG